MFDKPYDPKPVESKIYKTWEKSGYFNPDNLPVNKIGNSKLSARGVRPRPIRLRRRSAFGGKIRNYVAYMPLPNVTGSLHMGHALDNTGPDILIRYNRMRGMRTLWFPGTDHAGIATQYVVEKELKKEGKNRWDLGREKFIERVWEWKEKYGGIIIEQLKKLGVSADWSRKRFTMDPDYGRDVLNAFVHYYKKGWVYRGLRTVNWCPRCQTSLSELELEYTEEDAPLYYIKYGPFSLATVRPETKFGDTALAVNPKDARYKKFIGKTIEIDSLSTEGALEKPELKKIKLQIVGDEAVDPKFGTGVIKVTPAHDITDFEISKRHNLPMVAVIDERGRMNTNAGKYAGMKVSEARIKIVEDLGAVGLILKEESYNHRVAKCYRCNTTIEPLPSNQWFLKMSSRGGSLSKTDGPRAHALGGDSLVSMAIKAVRSGKTKITPKNFEKIYLNWLKNIRDWTISRQIWWGHQLPVWHCKPNRNIQIMGFYEKIVPQVLKKGKSRTYRLRNHQLKMGGLVAFENSQTKTIFGHAKVTDIVRKKIKDIELPDPIHGGGYKSLDELLSAFRRHYPPDQIITGDTETLIYDFEFIPLPKENPSGGCNYVVVGNEKPLHCPNCKGTNLARDTDVLDTWFSSALWPFAGLSEADKKKYYPGNLVSNAREILNLWDARMIFSGLEFMGKVPFENVLIHGTILTKEGKRMSKSLGTGIDPLKYIDEYGADATRFAVIWQANGQDIKWDEAAVIAGRKFANKIWNAARFVLQQSGISNFSAKGGSALGRQFPISKPKPRTAADKKILKELAETKKKIEKGLEKFEFSKALHELYDFFWHDFCDVYLEKSKSQITNHKLQKNTKGVLLCVLTESLKMLHPFMPFITEEVWSYLPQREKQLLLITKW